MRIHIGLNLILTAILAHEIWFVESEFEETGEIGWRDTLSAYLVSGSVIGLVVNNLVASISILF